MKTANFWITSIVIFFAIGVLSCNKSNLTADTTIDSAKLYKGIVIQEACPSYAIIQVTNAKIGADWTFGSTYKNVIAISNRPDSTKINGSISFYLSTSKNYTSCFIQHPCLQTIIIDKLPSNIYCAKNINTITY